MVQRITPRQFHASPGVEDWRVLFDGARTYFATGSFAKGVELVRRIGELADAANPAVTSASGTRRWPPRSRPRPANSASRPTRRAC
jgi:hypothetical protein